MRGVEGIETGAAACRSCRLGGRSGRRRAATCRRRSCTPIRRRILNQLANLVQNLGNQVKAGGADAALRYHLAHAQYRFGCSLAGNARPSDAAPAFADCIDQLKPVLEQDVKSAEALALQSACYGELAKQQAPRGGAAAVPGGRAAEAPRSRSRRAIRACCICSPWTACRGRSPGLAGKSSGHSQQLKECGAAVRADPRPPATTRPGWGHAEAYLALGMQLAAQRRCARRAQLDRKIPDRRAGLQGGATTTGGAGRGADGPEPGAAATCYHSAR